MKLLLYGHNFLFFCSVYTIQPCIQYHVVRSHMCLAINHIHAFLTHHSQAKLTADLPCKFSPSRGLIRHPSTVPQSDANSSRRGLIRHPSTVPEIASEAKEYVSLLTMFLSCGNGVGIINDPSGKWLHTQLARECSSVEAIYLSSSLSHFEMRLGLKERNWCGRAYLRYFLFLFMLAVVVVVFFLIKRNRKRKWAGRE